MCIRNSPGKSDLFAGAQLCESFNNFNISRLEKCYAILAEQSQTYKSCTNIIFQHFQQAPLQLIEIPPPPIFPSLSPIVHVLPQHRHVRAPWNVRKTSSFCRRRRRPRNSPLLFELLVSLFPAKLSQQTKKEWQVDLWRKIPIWRRFSPC